MSSSQFEVIRDPLWNNIRLEPQALAVLDTPAVQRLRYVRQLGHAFLVYPGATHTRLEHALGAYHLARRVVAELGDADSEEGLAVRLAALLHDIGHYPFSHALEEAGLPHHETLAARHLGSGALAAALDNLPIPTERLLALIQGTSAARLAGLVSGSIDVDKLDYLSRDAMMCGVPYGVIDVDRLLTSLTVSAEGVALHPKGLAALESLLFAKYQMYRNVYWHHAVRSATAMFKRLVRRAIAARRLTSEDIAALTDDALIHELERHDQTGLARGLRERRLAKRALDIQIPTCWSAWKSGSRASSDCTRISCFWTSPPSPTCSTSPYPWWDAAAARASTSGSPALRRSCIAPPSACGYSCSSRPKCRRGPLWSWSCCPARRRRHVW